MILFHGGYQAVMDDVTDLRQAALELRAGMDEIWVMLRQIRETHPSRRVVWLSAHSRSWRVRKKNQKRRTQFPGCR